MSYLVKADLEDSKQVGLLAGEKREGNLFGSTGTENPTMPRFTASSVKRSTAPRQRVSR